MEYLSVPHFISFLAWHMSQDEPGSCSRPDSAKDEFHRIIEK